MSGSGDSAPVKLATRLLTQLWWDLCSASAPGSTPMIPCSAPMSPRPETCLLDSSSLGVQPSPRALPEAEIPVLPA